MRGSLPWATPVRQPVAPAVSPIFANTRRRDHGVRLPGVLPGRGAAPTAVRAVVHRPSRLVDTMSWRQPVRAWERDAGEQPAIGSAEQLEQARARHPGPGRSLAAGSRAGRDPDAAARDGEPRAGRPAQGRRDDAAGHSGAARPHAAAGTHTRPGPRGGPAADLERPLRRLRPSPRREQRARGTRSRDRHSRCVRIRSRSAREHGSQRPERRRLGGGRRADRPVRASRGTC
jgi:hypothetical protein